MDKIMNNYYLLVFNNTNEAMMGEDFLKNEGFNVMVMPTPSQLINSCGISLIIKHEDVPAVKNLIYDNKLLCKGLYIKENSNFVKVE
jgi:hypothetical protein